MTRLRDHVVVQLIGLKIPVDFLGKPWATRQLKVETGEAKMVVRHFAAFDNEAFTVDPSSPFLTAGTGIINNSNTPVGTIFQFTDGFHYQTIRLDDLSTTPDVFNDDQSANHVIINGSGLIEDGALVESESFHTVRALDSNGDPTGPEIIINVLSQGGNLTDVWAMTSSVQLEHGVRYVKISGTSKGDTEYSTFVPCFTPGARVSTIRGFVAIEDLLIGDRVMTRDNGLQEVRWLGSKLLPQSRLVADVRFRPIRIRKSALGPDMPMADMLVSPNHRMLINRPELVVLFGQDEMLIAAKYLVGLPGVEMMGAQDVSYIHILCDRHEVLLVDGTWTESFQPGDFIMNGMEQGQSNEIFALFPELHDPALSLRFNASRPTLRKFEANIAKSILSSA
ncbi:MAG: Hint domain-containing protein [Litoreibacter sp.]|uniref:Hint domain-containing protein n=1 Tax=Litoreibacter sp. TaxID=1969459 RepID=UPI00329A731F